MARRSLKPQLNQIRAWVRQGRTDAWIAHQLEVTAAELRDFRDQHGLTADDEDGGTQEVDLRDEIEAEIEASTAEEAAKEAEAAEAEEANEESSDDEEPSEDEEESSEDEETESARSEGSGEAGARPRRRRRRGRRGRGQRKMLEGTFDHGERDGYGLWLDAAIKDNPTYAAHWAGKREVTVQIESDRIIIRRAGEPEPDESDE